MSRTKNLLSKEKTLEDALKLPENVWGFLDWTTGALRINTDYNTFFNEDQNKGKLKLLLNETIYHEAFHYLQILSTGYLFGLVANISKEELSIVCNILKEALDSKNSIQDLYIELLKNEQIEQLRLTTKKYMFLDDKSSLGLTNRDIIESSAYFFQKSMTENISNIEQYLKLLEFAPSKEYSKAFLVAHKIIGESALIYFQSICFLSLLFFHPYQVFPVLCEFFKSCKYQPIEENKIIEQLVLLSKSYPYLGTSYIVCEKFHNGIYNPFFKGSYNLLVDFVEKEYEGSLFKLMSQPQKRFTDFYKNICRILIFNPDNVFSLIGKEKKSTDKVDDMLLTIITGANFMYYKQDKTGPSFLKLKI